VRILVCIIVFYLYLPCLKAQNGNDSSSSAVFLHHVSSMPTVAFDFIDKKYSSLTHDIDRQTFKMLKRMLRREDELQKKPLGADSDRVKQFFAAGKIHYQELETKLQNPLDISSFDRLKQYLPGLDSMGTTMHFLASNKGIPGDKLALIQNICGDVQQLQERLQQANEVQAFVKEREEQLKDRLNQYGLGKQLLGINKEVYYYQQRLQQYKDLINNPEKLSEVILAKVRSMPMFESFWQHNSMLAQLFPMPQNYGSSVTLTGLQTRDQVASFISQRMPGVSTPTANDNTSYLQQQLQTAQSQISTLRDKISKLGGGSDMTTPDFTPNSQRTKSLRQRLEYGVNFQTSQATNLLPTISDIGLTLGYRLSDKAVMGIGTSYKLGLGRGFNHIALTNEGVSMRSYMDLKAKGSIWITGGYEYNYIQQFAKLSDLRSNIHLWQKSALIGITKKYRVSKSKEGNIQLLYDFLYKYEVPRSAALKFRVGYRF